MVGGIKNNHNHSRQAYNNLLNLTLRRKHSWLHLLSFLFPPQRMTNKHIRGYRVLPDSHLRLYTLCLPAAFGSGHTVRLVTIKRKWWGKRSLDKEVLSLRWVNTKHSEHTYIATGITSKNQNRCCCTLLRKRPSPITAPLPLLTIHWILPLLLTCMVMLKDSP